MPNGPGFFDENNIWIPGEDDNVSPISDFVAPIATSASDAITQLKAGLTDIETEQELVRDEFTALGLRTVPRGGVISGASSIYANGDSFLAADLSNTPGARYIQQLAAKYGKAVQNAAVGGSWMQDVANRSIGIAAPIASNLPSDALVLLAAGINEITTKHADAPTLQAYKWNLESLIWTAAAKARIEHPAFTFTGTWSEYASPNDNYEKFSAGNARFSQTVGNYAQYVSNAAANFVALAPFFTSAIVANTGKWLLDGVQVFANSNTQAVITGTLGSIVGHRPVRIFNVASGAHTIRAEATAAGYTFLDVLLELSLTPPTIIIVKPAYVRWGTYQIPDSEVDLYRAAIDEVVASVRTAYSPLRGGKIVVVDPGLGNFDRNTQTGADGLHLNDAGHAWMLDLIERTLDGSAGTQRAALDAIIAELLRDPTSAARAAALGL